jgi:replicative DNA helicase
MSTLERNVFDLAQIKGYFDRVAAWDPSDAIPSPWPTLNRHCGGFGGGHGFAPGWYVVLGGSTGAGKSLAALNVATKALLSRWKVGFVTLEMSPEQLQTRLWSMLFGVEVSKIQPGRWYDPREAERLKGLVRDALTDWPGAAFRVNEVRLRNLPDMLDLMHQWREGWGIQVFVVDYMQLCRVPDETETHKRIQAVSAEVCDFAHETKSLVLGLSQFHSMARRNRDHPPTVDSLYGGVDLGNDADLVLLLDHSRYEKDQASPHLARTYLIHGKNREGPLSDDIPLLWDYRNLTAREALPDEEALWPE